MKKSDWLRKALIVPLAAMLSGCQIFGMAGAARITGETFDKAECLARDFKGEEPCPEPAPQR